MVKRYQDIVRGVTPICEEAPVHNVHERGTNRIIGTHSATRGFQPSRPGEYQEHTGSKILPHSMRIGDRIESDRRPVFTPRPPLRESTHGGVGPWSGKISSPYGPDEGALDITMKGSDGTTKRLKNVSHQYSDMFPSLDDYADQVGDNPHFQHAAYQKGEYNLGQDFLAHLQKEHGLSWHEAHAVKDHIDQIRAGFHKEKGYMNTTQHPHVPVDHPNFDAPHYTD